MARLAGPLGGLILDVLDQGAADSTILAGDDRAAPTARLAEDVIRLFPQVLGKNIPLPVAALAPYREVFQPWLRFHWQLTVGGE